MSSRSADRSMVIGWLNCQSLRNKTVAVHTTITEQSLDVLALTETWHDNSNDASLRLCTPDGYALVDAARTTGRGGGVAVLFRKHLKCSRLSLPACQTFEAIGVRLISASGPVIIVNIYRCGSERSSSLFFEELTSLLETFVVYSCPVVIGGDFNLRVNDETSTDARQLADLLQSFDMVQHVCDPTHRAGNTLDLVITFADRPPTDVSVDPPGAISDHSLVTCCIPASVDSPPLSERLVRAWRRVDRDQLASLLTASPLCGPLPPTPDTDVDQLFDTYNTVLLDLANQLAPAHVIRRRPGRPTPWFDADCRAHRRQCHRLERRYRRTGRPDDRRRWVEATRRRFSLYRGKKEQYWSNRLLQCDRSSATLWRCMSSVLGRGRDVTASTNNTAQGLADFFKKKIDDIRSATSGLVPPPVTRRASSSLSSFQLFTEAAVRRIIMTSPTKSCSLDPVPTFLLREFIDLLLPYVTAMVNASLVQGRLPVSQRHAIVTPRLKKQGLDASNMSNYRPVSNLSFMSKVMERAVSSRLNDYLLANDLLPRFQSAYRKRHSTETALLRVWSDILTAADQRHVTLLGLLDMSAAFDCVDHDLLLQRLQLGFGLTGVVLQWIYSFLHGRTQQVLYNGTASTIQQLLFGVPQGSVLGPLLYVLYTAELSDVITQHGLRFHQYADDSQIYVCTTVNEAPLAVQRFTACVSDISDWMSASRLKLNPMKTEVLWLGSSQLLSQISITDIPLQSTTTRVVESARDLGVVIDSKLSLSAHVASLCRAGFYHLRQLRPILKSLTHVAARTLVQAFISCRLDYCNSLLYGVSRSLIRKVQSIQNAAARLLTGAKRRDHISPVLRQLHWLPVQRRVDFKLACFVFLSLSGRAPSYLADDIHLVAEGPRRRLRSSTDRSCAVPRTRSTFGDRSFSVAGPRVWDSLPAHLRDEEISYNSFRRELKTYWFRGDRGAMWQIFCLIARYKYPY